MSSYRTYRKKVKDSQLSEAGTSEIYKPIWFAYEIMDSFLGEGLTCKKYGESTYILLTHLEEQSTNNDGETVDEHGNQSENVEGFKKVSDMVRRRKHPPDLLEAGNAVKNALATLKTTTNKNNSQCQQDGDCDLYGKILAKKLRQLPADDKLKFMYEIDGMFIRRCRSWLQSPAYCLPAGTTYVPSPSPSPTSTFSYNYNQFNRAPPIPAPTLILT
nr:unnamed protein product [Callosobruchus analis]